MKKRKWVYVYSNSFYKDEFYSDTINCPVCKARVLVDNYCAQCGVKFINRKGK